MSGWCSFLSDLFYKWEKGGGGGETWKEAYSWIFFSFLVKDVNSKLFENCLEYC